MFDEYFLLFLKKKKKIGTAQLDMVQIKDSIKNAVKNQKNQNQTKYFSTIRYGFFRVKIFTIHDIPPKESRETRVENT